LFLLIDKFIVRLLQHDKDLVASRNHDALCHLLAEEHALDLQALKAVNLTYLKRTSAIFVDQKGTWLVAGAQRSQTGHGSQLAAR